MKFLKKPQDNKKKGIYIIAGIVGIIVFFIWISLPLMQKSSWDASVYSYGMSKKSADLSLLDSGGIDAPGAPLTGALIDNPATSLELEASSLFKMPESDIKYEEESKNEDAAISSSSSDSSVNPPSVSYQAQQNTSVGKLNKLPSLGGSSGGTMTVGTTHDKFFGSQKAEAKLLPLESKSEELKSNKKGNLALAALKVAEKNSVLAQNAPSLEQSKSAGTSAFEKTVKVDENFLNSKEEKAAAESGLSLSKTEADLKKNDPNLSKKKITLPQPTKDEDETKKMEEQLKMMILQMIIQATLGNIFGAIGQSLAFSITGGLNKNTGVSAN